MQSVRNEEISVQLGVEEKACVDEMIKQAELSLESQELLDQSIGVTAENERIDRAAAATKIQILAGVLKNQTKGPLNLMATKKYAGHILKNFPNSFAITGAFSMSAMSHKGVKSAALYSGKNQYGVECAWLLAFADTNATGRRIYAECGHKRKFSNINWDHVEDKLNKAGAVAKAYDPETGTSLVATIVGSSGKSAVGAAYLG